MTAEVQQAEAAVEASGASGEAGDAGDAPVYCLCKGPESGFMLFCEKCEDWFHGACVGIKKRQASKIDKYLCPNCAPEPTTPEKKAEPEEPTSKSRSGRSIKKKKWDEEEYEYDFKKDEDDDYKDEEDSDEEPKKKKKVVQASPKPSPIARPNFTPSPQIPHPNSHQFHPSAQPIFYQNPNVNSTIHAINSINHYNNNNIQQHIPQYTHNIHQQQQILQQHPHMFSAMPNTILNPLPNLMSGPIPPPPMPNPVSTSPGGQKRTYTAAHGTPPAQKEEQSKLMRRESFPPQGGAATKA